MDELLKEAETLIAGQDSSGFSSAEYADTLELYAANFQSFFEKLTKKYEESGQDEEILKAVCNAAVKAASADLKDKSKYRRLGSRSIRQYDYKMILVAYTSPVLLRSPLSIGQVMPGLLREAWMAEFPGDRYEIAGEQVIKSGFGQNWIERLFRRN